MKELLKNTTRKYASGYWRLCAKFPVSREYNAYSDQLIRGSGAVEGNYRVACRAKFMLIL